MYDLRVHTIREYFKTQMLALGVQADYVDYMMGHTIDTYHDIQSIGIDKLRNVYAAQDFRLDQKHRSAKLKPSKKSYAHGGMNSEQLLTRNALVEIAITCTNQTDIENHQLALLSNQLKEFIRNEKTS